jgi:hypothetical protein
MPPGNQEPSIKRDAASEPRQGERFCIVFIVREERGANTALRTVTLPIMSTIDLRSAFETT